MVWLPELVQKKSVIILIGAGGVGKTTCSIATALLGVKAGKNVGLISIDPAKRLAAAMGIKLDGSLSRIPLSSNYSAKGSLSAAMLDQQGVFDSMVERFAPNAKSAAAIKAHPFYHAASKNLAGALEFMALAKLQEMVESNEFDLVIVDTPPDAHALDFLARPDSISRFIDSKVTTWMLKPFAASKKLGLGMLFNKGEKFMGGIAKVAGFSALQMISEFLIMLQEVMAGFNRAGTRVSKTIRSDACAFVMVSAPRQAPVRTSLGMMKQMLDMKLPIDAMIVNRCLPTGVRASLDSKSAASESTIALQHLRRRLISEKAAMSALKQESQDCFPKLQSRLIDEIDGPMDSLESVLQIVSQLE